MESVVMSYFVCTLLMMVLMYMIYNKSVIKKEIIGKNESLFTMAESKQINAYDSTFIERLKKEMHVLKLLIRNKSENITLILQLQRNIENKLSDLMILNKTMFESKVTRISTKINQQVDAYMKTKSLIFEDRLSQDWSI